MAKRFSKEDDIKNLISVAKRYEQDAQFNRALKFYNLILSEDQHITEAIQAVRRIQSRDSKMQVEHLPEECKKFNLIEKLYQKRDYSQLLEEYKNLKQKLESNPKLLLMLAFAETDAGHLKEAEQHLKIASSLWPVNSLIWLRLGYVQGLQKKYFEAKQSYLEGLKVDPKSKELNFNLGNTYGALKEYHKAAQAFSNVINFYPKHTRSFQKLGAIFEKLNRLPEAISAYQQALKQDRTLEQVEVNLLKLQKKINHPLSDNTLIEASARLGVNSVPIPPWGCLSWADNPEHQMARAKNWARHFLKFNRENLHLEKKSQFDKIKVGYFSGDFHEHPSMFNTKGLFREHDKRNFEIQCFSYGSNKTGESRETIRSYADYFYDVASWSDQRILKFVREKNLDIAIDIMGYTRHTRSNLFQYGLAALQMNFLGYAGTMGSNCMDYIIADEVIIPESQRRFYTENVIYLPDSYFPSDDARKISDKKYKKSDFGIPKDSFVFCCFNANYKISSVELDIWTGIMKKVPHSVLWLLSTNKWAEENLKLNFLKNGLNPARLYFADRIPVSNHLKRIQLADLFLDTFNYNAHTTASDILWSGIPIVTKIGHQFAARVTASLLNAIDMPELITTTPSEYENLIIELASNPDTFRKLKAKLQKNRLSTPLFDTKRYTKNFEQGLKYAHQLKLKNLEFKDIWV